MSILKKFFLTIWCCLKTILWLFIVEGTMGFTIGIIFAYHYLAKTGVIPTASKISAAFSKGHFSMVVSLFITAVLVFVLYIVYHKRQPEMIPFEKKSAVSKYFKGYVSGIVIFGFIWLVAVLFGGFQVSFIFDFADIGMLCLFFAGYLFQGMSEEVLVRGYLYTKLKEFLPVMPVILISSLVFAVMHLGNAYMTWISFVNLFLFGVFTAIIRHKTNSLWFVGAFHSAWNFVQGPIFGIAVSGQGNQQFVLQSSAKDGVDLLSGGAFGLEGSLLTTIVLSAIILLILYKAKQVEKVFN